MNDVCLDSAEGFLSCNDEEWLERGLEKVIKQKVTFTKNSHHTFSTK